MSRHPHSRRGYGRPSPPNTRFSVRLVVVIHMSHRRTHIFPSGESGSSGGGKEARGGDIKIIIKKTLRFFFPLNF